MRRLTALLVAGLAFTLYYLGLFELTKNEGESGTPALARSAATAKPIDSGSEMHAAAVPAPER
jgi:hypothetical protein